MLHLPLEIESTESALKLSVDRLVDCGATSEFIDSEYASAIGLPLRRLMRAIPILNVDSTPNEVPNEAGAIQESPTLSSDMKGIRNGSSLPSRG